MADAVEPPPPDAPDLERAAALLGGERILRRSLSGSIDTHDMLTSGLAVEAFRHLLDGLTIIPRAGALERALGMSLRTVQRRTGTGTGALTPEQSGHVWTFARILAMADAIFGSREAAERWMDSPAMGLDGRRPIDLLASPVGVSLVEDFLERMRYGVYT